MNKIKVIVIIVLIAVLILLFLFMIYGSVEKENSTLNNNTIENSDNDKKETVEIVKYDISSDKYFALINDIFSKTIEDNEFLYYDGYVKYYPYIQIAIKPKTKISKAVMEEQSKIISSEILSQLKKYKYKSGGIFKYNYEYINIYFYNYTDTGQLNRNGGPFIQFEILNVKKLKVEDIVR